MVEVPKTKTFCRIKSYPESMKIGLTHVLHGVACTCAAALTGVDHPSICPMHNCLPIPAPSDGALPPVDHRYNTGWTANPSKHNSKICQGILKTLLHLFVFTKYYNSTLTKISTKLKTLTFLSTHLYLNDTRRSHPPSLYIPG